MIEILVNGDGMGRTVLDGSDISGSINGFSVQSRCGERTLVTLHVQSEITGVRITDEQVAFDLAAPARRLLEAVEHCFDMRLPGGVQSAHRALRALLP